MFKDFSNPANWGLMPALALVVLGVFGGQLLGLLVVALGLMVSGQATSILEAVGLVDDSVQLTFIMYALAQVGVLLLVHLFVRSRGGWRSLGFQSVAWRRALKVVGLSLLGFFIAAAVVIGVLEVVAPQIDFTAEQEIGFLDAAGGIELVLAFVALVVLAPLAEEILFRGVLLPAAVKRLGAWGAIMFTSLLFGLLHPPVSAMITIGVFSIFLCIVYLKTNSIWPAILLHSGKNLLAFIALFGLGL